MKKRGLAVVAGAAMAMGALAACSSKSETPDVSEPAGAVTITETQGEWFNDDLEDGVAAVEEDGKLTGLVLTLGGSGTEACAPVLEGGLVSGEELLLTLAPVDPGQACNADLVPYSWDITVDHPERITHVVVEDADHEAVNEFRVGGDES